MTEFQPWPRDPRYLVGDDGTILGPRGRPVGSPGTDGYLRVATRVGGKRTSFSQAHAMVCETFHGPRPAGMEVAHKNGVRTDNRAANLRWATHADNMADCARHGTQTLLPGESNPQARATDGVVRAIRAAHAVGASQTALAARFSLGRTTISQIVNRKSWAHVA